MSNLRHYLAAPAVLFPKDTDSIKYTAPIVASTTIGGEVLTRTASLVYQINQRKHTVCLAQDLAIDPCAQTLFSQDLSMLTPILKHMSSGVKNVSFPMSGKHMYDMRAICYTLGALYAQSTINGHLPLAQCASVQYNTLSVNDPDYCMSELILAPGLIGNGNELGYFCRVCKIAGVTSIRALTAQLSTSMNLIYDHEHISDFTFRFMINVISDDLANNRGLHSWLAFARGLSSGWTLVSHNNEGGWLRKLLRGANYPPSCGILTKVGGTFLGYEALQLNQRSTVNTFCLMSLLSLARIIPLCDEGEVGQDPTKRITLTTFSKDASAPCYVDSFIGLAEFMQITWGRLESKLAAYIGVASSGINETWSVDHGTFMSLDHHLELDQITPFYWVDPAGINFTDNVQENFMPTLQVGEPTVLPLWANATYSFCHQSLGANGMAVPGTSYRLLLKNTSARHCGAHYFLSLGFGRVNGLCGYKYMKAFPEYGGTVLGHPPMTGPEYNVSKARWSTPHCPLPNPAEMVVYDIPIALDYVHGGSSRHWDRTTLANATVTVTPCVGTLSYGKLTGKVLSSRHHPQRLTRIYCRARGLRWADPPREWVFEGIETHPNILINKNLLEEMQGLPPSADPRQLVALQPHVVNTDVAALNELQMEVEEQHNEWPASQDNETFQHMVATDPGEDYDPLSCDGEKGGLYPPSPALRQELVDMKEKEYMETYGSEACIHDPGLDDDSYIVASAAGVTTNIVPLASIRTHGGRTIAQPRAETINRHEQRIDGK